MVSLLSRNKLSFDYCHVCPFGLTCRSTSKVDQRKRKIIADLKKPDRSKVPSIFHSEVNDWSWVSACGVRNKEFKKQSVHCRVNHEVMENGRTLGKTLTTLDARRWPFEPGWREAIIRLYLNCNDLLLYESWSKLNFGTENEFLNLGFSGKGYSVLRKMRGAICVHRFMGFRVGGKSMNCY